jgi:3',5'-cyclic AMP phosphodiesterase CpdA
VSVRTVVHLSDLHFGRIDPALIEPCISVVHSARPNLVVVSGDLTQRARASQFRQASEFLQRLPDPRIVVPGNHDVPLHNVFARFLRPFTGYRRYVSTDLEPLHQDDEIAVASINTARSLTIDGGHITARQVQRVRQWLCELPAGLVKIVVTHHPFGLPPAFREKHRVRGAANAMAALARCGADLFLAGHLHVFHTELSARRFVLPGCSALLVQAGTGLSTRTRHGEGNTFNILRVSSGEIVVETFCWSHTQGMFQVSRTDRFHRTDSGWDRYAA